MYRNKFENEIWKDILGYEGYYQVSNYGRVKSIKRNTKNQFKYFERIKEPYIGNNGYLCVVLYKDNKSKHFSIHRLVANAFVDNPNNLPQVNHIDCNKKNNKVNNLEWVTASDNMKHAIKNNLIKWIVKSVLQYSKDGEFIREWYSINEASRKLKIQHSNIISCCKGKRKTAGNYIWKYKEEK